MTFTVEISSDVQEKDWNKSLEKNEKSYAHQTANFIRIFKEAYSSEPIFIKVQDSKGNIAAQLAASLHKKFVWSATGELLRRFGLKFNLNSTISWRYGPVIHDDSNKDIILELILKEINRYALKKKVDMIYGTSTHSLTSTPKLIYKNNGFTLKKWATKIIDLQQNIDDLYNSYDKILRYDIRKSEKNNFVFEVKNDLKTIKEYVRLKIKFRKETGLPVKINEGFPEERFNELHKNNYEKLFTVKYEGKIIGGMFTTLFNGKLHQNSVTASIRRDLLPGIFLTWNAIKWGNSQGYRKFDMGGFNPDPNSGKEKSIAFFKLKWGGEYTEYYFFANILNKSKVAFSKVLRDPSIIKNKISSKIFK